MSVENVSTGIEASASGESLNSGDPAVHPAARHSTFLKICFFKIRPEGNICGTFKKKGKMYFIERRV